ncbi:MAG: hypothetical protein JNL67_00715 [Planctomycetaceae bacterium]|nr:hypothetical protein [Planctomycetaceae bacterium]
MESEALDKRMAREATIGLVVLVVLVGLLFLTIWLKAQAAWTVDEESVLSSRVNVFELDRGNVLTPLKKPPPVPLPDVESNHIVDLGEMRPISSERMAAMLGSDSQGLRVAVVDPTTALPGFPDRGATSLPSPEVSDAPLANSPLPNLDLPPNRSIQAELPRADLPAAPSLLPQLGSLPAVPGRGPETSLPPVLPGSGGSSVPSPVPSELEKIPNRDEPSTDSSATEPVPRSDSTGVTLLAVDNSQPDGEDELMAEGLNQVGSTSIALTPLPNAVGLPRNPSTPSPVQSSPVINGREIRSPLTQLPPPGQEEAESPIVAGSSVEVSVAEIATQERESGLSQERTANAGAASASEPILDALQRAAAQAQSSNTTVTVYATEDDAENEKAADGEAEPASYSTQELKAAMQRLSLPPGMSMAELSRRLYGDTRYALALQQLNHRRADDRGRFLPGTQIAYLPAPMLSFVYPDLVKPESLSVESGTISTVQYQEPLTTQAPTQRPTPTQAPTSRSSKPGPRSGRVAESPLPNPAPRDSSESTLPGQEVPASGVQTAPVSPEWIMTEGGESLFQLAVDHFDQASYYLQLYEWNRVAMEGRYRPTDPLPKGMRIRLAPPTP